MTQTFRPGLSEIPAYRPGLPAPVGADGRSAKLSSNENPYPPLPQVLAALNATLPAAVHRYPSIAATELRTQLAKRLNVPAECLVFGAGSVEVAGQLIHALAGAGDEVMFAWRSFEAYPILVRVAGAEPVQVPLDSEARHDLPAMLAAITPRTRLIFICNPNNPTGTVVTTAQLSEFLAAVPPQVAVVIDEAYVHFDTAADSPDGLEFFRRYPNVQVLHTFSKAYGLAGLRIGYAVAQPEVAQALQKVALPFGVSTLAQAAAVASLAAESELAQRIATIVSERAAVEHSLVTAGVPCVSSQANFLWLPLGELSDAAEQVLRARGISARVFSGEGIRVSIGDPAENALVQSAASELASLVAQSPDAFMTQQEA